MADHIDMNTMAMDNSTGMAPAPHSQDKDGMMRDALVNHLEHIRPGVATMMKNHKELVFTSTCVDCARMIGDHLKPPSCGNQSGECIPQTFVPHIVDDVRELFTVTTKLEEDTLRLRDLEQKLAVAKKQFSENHGADVTRELQRILLNGEKHQAKLVQPNDARDALMFQQIGLHQQQQQNKQNT